MAYMFGVGYDLALVDLVALDPQPRTDATVQAVQRSYSANGSIHEQGGWIEMLFDALDGPEEYQTLLTQITLLDVLQVLGTWYLPDHAYRWGCYNGIVQRPAQGQDITRSGYFIRDVTLRVTHLVKIS